MFGYSSHMNENNSINNAARDAGLFSILTFSKIDSVMFGDFEPCEGRWGIDTANAEEIDLGDVIEEMERQIAEKMGHPATVQLFHSNGHAIAGGHPGHGTFLATRK